MPEDIIRERASSRGDKMEDIESRLDSEREMFNAFKDSGKYDAIIDTYKTEAEVKRRMGEVLSELGIMRL